MGVCFSESSSRPSRTCYSVSTQTYVSYPMNYHGYDDKNISPICSKNFEKININSPRISKTESHSSRYSIGSDTTPNKSIGVQDIIQHRFIRSMDENLYRVSIERYNSALRAAVSLMPPELNKTEHIALH